MIEDSPHGVMAARRAGMAPIGLRTAATASLVLDGCLAVVDGLDACAPHLGFADDGV